MSRKKPLKSPVARMVLSGGVVYVPPEAYLRRLQRLYQAGNLTAHANTLYPGIAYIAVAPDSFVTSLFRTILMVSDGGRRLQGLESLFLSCLQGVALAGNDRTALGGLAAWSHYKAGKNNWRLVLVDRRTNQFTYVSLKPAEMFLRRCSATALSRKLPWDILQAVQQERAGSPPIGGFVKPGSTSDAEDTPTMCKYAKTELLVGQTR